MGNHFTSAAFALPKAAKVRYAQPSYEHLPAQES